MAGEGQRALKRAEMNMSRESSRLLVPNEYSRQTGGRKVV